MEDAQIVAVEVEAADIVPLLGRTFDALLVKRGIDNGAVNLGRLEPHELMEALHNAAWSLQSTSDNPDETSGVYLDAAKFDLVRSGLMSQAEVDSTADPFAGESQASGHYDGGGDHGELPIELTEAVPDQFDPFN
jgi:hypothetical protein